MAETSLRNGLTDLLLPSLEIFAAKAELLAFSADILGAVAGKSLVLVPGNQETADVIGLSSQLDRPVQAVARVPAQADRLGVSVATYTMMNRLAGEAYGHLQLRLSAFDLVLLQNPHTLALSTLRNAAETVKELPVMVGAVMPQPGEKALLSELFLGKPSMAGQNTLVKQLPRYDAANWNGRRHSSD